MIRLIDTVSNSVTEGDIAKTEIGVAKALTNRLSPELILNRGLIIAMKRLITGFEDGLYRVSEVWNSSKALKAGLAMLKPALLDFGYESIGKVVIGTVKGDRHDIGKNLVGLMLEAAGFHVIDVGVDVPAEIFVEKIQTAQPDIAGLSALQTATMGNAIDVIKKLEEFGIRDKVKVLLGGAPVTQAYVDLIGCDGFASNAVEAVKKAKELCNVFN